MRHLLSLATAAALLAGGGIVAAAGQEARVLPDVVTGTIAYYATLGSYADTGTVSEEIAGMVHESRFATHFRRATRDFSLDYQPLRTRYPKLNGHVADMRGNRLVIWMAGGQMQTYSFYFKRHLRIGADAQTSALREGITGSTGVSVLIPSLLYAKSQLPGTLLQLERATLGGTDTVGGHRCHTITGEAAEYYPSGRRTHVRQVTLWIDAGSKLVRRIVEDKQTADGTPHRVTVSLEPQANPVIDDAKFAFAAPPSD